MGNLRSRIRQAVALGRDEGSRELSRRVWHYVKTRFVDRGTVIWFLRFTDPEKRPIRLSDRQLIKAETPEQHAFLDRYRKLLPDVREAREAAGGERWYVMEGDDLGCTFWTYSRRVIVSDRPLLTLPIPAGTYHMEDIYTPMRKRSAHIAAEALDALYRELRSRDIEYVVTKIDLENKLVVDSAYEYEWTEIAKVRGSRWLRKWTSWKILERSDPFYPELDRLERAPMRGGAVAASALALAIKPVN